MVGAVIAAILGFTDFLDGWIARRFNQTSELGRILDPISDRALFVTSFAVFLATQSIPLWFVLVIGIREVLITLGTFYVFLTSKIRLDVSNYGKISAFAAMVATPSWVMSSETIGSLHIFWTILALLCTLIAIPSGYYSILQYWVQFRQVDSELD